MARLAALAVVALAALAGCAAAAEPVTPAANPSLESLAMIDLTLTTPAKPVLSGENFAVEVSIVNRSGAAVDAPAGIGDGAYVFRLRPLDGGSEIAVSRDALSRKSAPGGVERMAPQTFGIRQTLEPGESRTVTVWPASLSTAPFPPGRYEMTVEMLDNSAPPSSPSPLTVVPRAIVAHHAIGAVGLDSPETLFLHQSGDALALFGGAGETEGPVWMAGLRLADIEGPADGLSFALAQRRDGASGAIAAGWLRDGAFHGVAARTAYVVATVGPVDLGLADATIAPVGWEADSDVIGAVFALMGRGARGVEFAFVSFGGDGGWTPVLRRTPLPFPELPTLWRATRSADGGATLCAAFPSEAGGVLRRVTIAADGTAGPVEEALRTAAPITALSAPLDAREGSAVQALSGPVLAEDHARMALHLAPLDGGPALEREFLMPLANGAPPGSWALAEGAPMPAYLAAASGDALLGLRIDDQIEGVFLARDAVGARGLQAILVRDRGWAIWRDPHGDLRQAPFPP